VSPAEDRHLVGDLRPGGEHEPFRMSIRAGFGAGSSRPRYSVGQDCGKRCGELPSPVSDQEPEVGLGRLLAPHRLLALHRCSSSRSCLGGSTGYERSTLCVRGDVLLWVALKASLMAECLADGAGDADCGIGVSELVGASHVSEHAADGDFGLGHAGCSSCRR
jgi:hypothetical protein